MTDINYYPLYLGGSCSQLAELIDGQRLYSRGDDYKIEGLDMYADFDFPWWQEAHLMNFQTVWPLQLMFVNDELDYNSFHSLN